MQLPSPDHFRHEDGYAVAPPWSAPVAGAGLELLVSDWEGAPDANSLALAERVLPRLDELRAAAAEYAGRSADVRWMPRLDPAEAEILSVFCDGGSATVILEMHWGADRDRLWFVRFNESPHAGMSALEFGCREKSGGDLPRWRAPFGPGDD